MTGNDLARISDVLVLSAIAVYGVAMLGFAASLAGRRRVAAPVPIEEPALVGAPGDVPSPSRDGAAQPPVSLADRIGRVAVSLSLLAVVLHAAAVLTRGLAVARAPWGNMYEFALTGSLAASCAFLVLLRRAPVRDLGVWVTGLVILALGLGVTVLYTPADDLVPALNSWWLVVHVAAAIIAGGVFTAGAGAMVLDLLRRRRREPGQPADDVLARVAHGAHLFAFPVWTFAVLAGAIWAEAAWGRYWGWDPKETWAFITWVLYAAYLHSEATAGRWRRRAPWFALAGYAAFLFNFFGINLWITGLHSYAGV